MPRLNEDQRNNTIGRLQAGETQTPASRRWLRTVWSEILRCPGIAAAVDIAVVNLSRK
jgi:hypothetical protein